MSRLANIIDVTVFQDLPPEDYPEKTALFQSGVIVRSPLFDNLAEAPGKTVELPFWKDLDPTVEQNYSNDNPADLATPLQLSQEEQITRKAFLNQGWTESDLAAELAMGGNAMRRIRARVDTYWTRRWQRRLVKTAVGVMLQNVANDSGDMVHDISTQDGANATDSNLFSRTAMVAAAFTMGDHFDGFRAIAVHSVVAQRISSASSRAASRGPIANRWSVPSRSNRTADRPPAVTPAASIASPLTSLSLSPSSTMPSA